jgi:hypothetical protein
VKQDFSGGDRHRKNKLVEASHTNKWGISRSTFERMLRKAKQFGILTIHHTTRKKGGYSHNVYVFHRIDGSPNNQLTDRSTLEKRTTPPTQTTKTDSEAIFIENKTKIRKDLRRTTLEELDYTYVPSYVPEEFVKTVRPFYSRAKEICQFWDRALIAHRSYIINTPIQYFIPVIIKAFKETVYQWKRKKVRTTFEAYFYGTVVGMMTVEVRRMVARGRTGRCWLEG